MRGIHLITQLFKSILNPEAGTAQQAASFPARLGILVQYSAAGRDATALFDSSRFLNARGKGHA